MKYYPIAAHNRNLVVIEDMETFTHYFCFTVKQKKGQVPELSYTGMPEEHAGTGAVPAYEIDEEALLDDDQL